MVTEIIRGPRQIKLKVKYEHNGKSFEETSRNLKNLWFRSFRRGEKFRLFLDPKKPSDFAVYEAGAYKVYPRKYPNTDTRDD